MPIKGWGIKRQLCQLRAGEEAVMPIKGWGRGSYASQVLGNRLVCQLRAGEEAVMPLKGWGRG